MKFDFSQKKKVIIDQKDYVDAMVDNFSIKINDTEKTPAAEDLFSEGENKLIDNVKFRYSNTPLSCETGR